MNPNFLPLAAFILVFSPGVTSAGLFLDRSVNLEIPDNDLNGLVSVINFNT